MASMMISGLIPLLQQPELMLDMEEQRRKLLDFFTNTLPMLADAELRAEAETDVRTWLDELNAVAYDADDIVDDFRYAKLQAEAEVEGCQNRNGGRVRAALFLFSCFKNSTINRSEVLQGIENRIGSVVQKVEGLDERMRVLKFQPSKEINIIASAEMSQQLIFSFSSPTEIVGRDKEKKDVVGNLLTSSRKRVKLCITGPRGIGKTALVRSVCNDTRIGEHFEYVLWVEVRPEFNIGKVAKSIIDQVIGKDCCISEDNTDLLEIRFYQELSFKRCIIVVDGLQEVHQQLLDELQLWIDVISGNYIFLIAICGSIKLPDPQFGIIQYTLKPLMGKDGWRLFRKKAFPDHCLNTCPEILKEMGKEIMVKCGGSPLALNMMGGLMRFKKGTEEWQGVINQLKKVVLNDIGVSIVETIIKVCYDNLCSQVKQCFAFCSLFPEGHYMDKEVMIKLWMANGLLLHSNGSGSMPLEEKGNIVFNELASRNFFEEVKHVHGNYSYKTKHGYHSRVTCKLHFLIHKQAVIAATEFALLKSIPDDSPVDIRKLLQNNRRVRVLLSPYDPFIRTVSCSALPKANSLRGLHLPSALFSKKAPLELKYMRHLRYLDLSASRIQTLPENTSLLYFLETLNLSKCLLLYQLPQNMMYMRSLRNLYTHKCPKLKKMPAHLRQLNNLQTLTTYIVGEQIAGTGIDEIKGLHLSGLLELYNLHKVKTAAMAKEADLILKTNLDRLTLCWGSEQLVMPKENNDLVVLEALRPHNQLKVLKIQQYGGKKFSTWLADPMATGLVNLVELHLIGCSQCTTLPAVWKLSSLRVLCLKHMVSLTCICHTDDSVIHFQTLKRLVLVGLKKLETWKQEEHEKEEEEEEKERATCSNLKTTCEKVVFTVLDELKITSCPNLKTMPHAPQLKHITAVIENYKLLQSVTDLITQEMSLVEEANIAKANDAHNEPFPPLGAEVEGRVNKKLRTMRMDSTNSVFKPTALPHSLLGLWRPFEELRYLEIFNCDTLFFWPPEFIHLKMLIRLSIRNCPNLTSELPDQVNTNKSLFPKLRKLEFYGCNSLKQVPYCEILDVLELDECPVVESVLASTSSVMKILYLSCTSWISLPSELGTIEMRTLWLSECYSLTSLPDWLARQPYLKTLIINECPLLKKLPGGHEWLSSLEKLQISKCPDLEKFCNEEPYSSIISQIGIGNPLSTNEDDDAAAFAGASTTGAPNTPPTQISALNRDMKGMVDIKPRIVEDASDKSKMWKLTEINEPTQCRTIRLMRNFSKYEISILVYTNSGAGLFTLDSNAIILLWKWPRNNNNPNGKATAGITPQLMQSRSGILMKNDVTDCNPEDAVPCFALLDNDSDAVSASGGRISVFDMIDFKKIETFMPPPPAATSLALQPQDNDIIAIGMDDSTILIYNIEDHEIISILNGHSKRITGLAFSNVLNVLVSSGADSQICVWSTNKWKKRRSKFLPYPHSHSGSNMYHTRVQFHQNQINFLVVHVNRISICEATNLECHRQWVPRENAAPPISDATFSCDGQLVYATFVDATVCILSASNLKLRCRILPAAYLPSNVSPNVHPLVVAAHPQKPNQFAIGLTDGGVHVIEPLESEGKWGAAPPSENESSSSLPPKAAQTPGASSSGTK